MSVAWEGNIYPTLYGRLQIIDSAFFSVLKFLNNNHNHNNNEIRPTKERSEQRLHQQSKCKGWKLVLH